MLIHYKPTVPVLNRRLAREWGVVMAVPFCEQDGIVTREYVSGQNLDIMNGASMSNQSLYCDGTGDAVECGSSYNHKLLGAITVLCHCKLSDIDNEQTFAGKHQTVHNNKRGFWFGQYDYPGAQRLVILASSNGSSQTNVNGNTDLTLNSTITAAGVFQPSRFFRLYLNGELDGQSTSSIPSGVFNSDRTWRIGRRHHDDDSVIAPFNGTMYNIAICNIALNKEQIREYHNDPMILFKPDPPHVFYSFPQRPRLVFRRFV